MIDQLQGLRGALADLTAKKTLTLAILGVLAVVATGSFGIGLVVGRHHARRS